MKDPYEDDRFSGRCPTCGQSFQADKLEEAHNEIEQLKAKVAELENKPIDRELIIELVHGAARHLRGVMVSYDFPDHVQVVKHYADIRIAMIKEAGTL